MLDRRAFLAASAMTGVASLGVFGTAAAESGESKDYYELRAYQLDTEDQKKGLIQFLEAAAIPALNRLGVNPVGVFETPDVPGPVYVLMRYASLEVFATATQKLLADAEFLGKGAAFLDAPAASPAYKRVESSALAAFTGMPHLETPAQGPGRLFQLRIYESPSVKTGQKKIEMFNTAELAIFRRVGLTAVFFGECLAGAKMPNLTYMLGFDNADAQDAAWKRFRDDPDWKALRTRPEYDDKAILCGITNLVLKPAAGSQI